mmetsp:Transcript_47670/g.136118  ORF Transcript_47670/g.136118 Transcript_47670/m.136118 type:complete len:391 (-) Transcript_47670:55-1227(-)
MVATQLRSVRDRCFLDSSPWAWRSTRQAAARKARDLLADKVDGLAARLACVELPLQLSPDVDYDNKLTLLEARLNSYSDIVTARLDGLHEEMSRMADAPEALEKLNHVGPLMLQRIIDLENKNDILAARLDGLHAKCARMAEAQEAQTRAFQSDLELFSGQLLSMQTAVEHLPDENIIKQMVDEAKSYLDASLDTAVAKKLALFDAKVFQHVSVEIKRVKKKPAEEAAQLCCRLEDIAANISQHVLNINAPEIDALKNNMVQKDDLEALMTSLSESMTQNVMRNTNGLLEGINGHWEARVLVALDRIEALDARIGAQQEVMQDWVIAETAAEGLAASFSASSAPTPVTSTKAASSSTKASINYSKFDWINDESSDDDRPQWVQARDGPKR